MSAISSCSSAFFDYDTAEQYFSRCFVDYLQGQNFEKAYKLFEGMRKENMQVSATLPKAESASFLEFLCNYNQALAQDFSDLFKS